MTLIEQIRAITSEVIAAHESDDPSRPDYDGLRLAAAIDAYDYALRPEVVMKLLDVADALESVLPMAKGYAHAHQVGANAEKVQSAEQFLKALSSCPSLNN